MYIFLGDAAHQILSSESLCLRTLEEGGMNSLYQPGCSLPYFPAFPYYMETSKAVPDTYVDT